MEAGRENKDGAGLRQGGRAGEGGGVAQDILVWQGGQGTLKWLRPQGQIP